MDDAFFGLAMPKLVLVDRWLLYVPAAEITRLPPELLGPQGFWSSLMRRPLDALGLRRQKIRHRRSGNGASELLAVEIMRVPASITVKSSVLVRPMGSRYCELVFSQKIRLYVLGLSSAALLRLEFNRSVAKSVNAIVSALRKRAQSVRVEPVGPAERISSCVLKEAS